MSQLGCLISNSKLKIMFTSIIFGILFIVAVVVIYRTIQNRRNRP